MSIYSPIQVGVPESEFSSARKWYCILSWYLVLLSFCEQRPSAKKHKKIFYFRSISALNSMGIRSDVAGPVIILPSGW
jgi:hypothetical protein